MRAFQSLARFRLRITSHFSPSNPWCTGEDSNLRSSKERQIYSLLPLTARPPVHNLNTRGATVHTNPFRRRFPAQTSSEETGQFGMIAAGYSGPKLWSWGRDLNPRPSDYKSDALPAELRQPEQPCSLPSFDRITIAKVTTESGRLVQAAEPNPGAMIPATDEGRKPDIACPGALRRPSSLFYWFCCWWRWLPTCAARLRPRPLGCFRNPPASSISICRRCAQPPT